MNNEGQLPLLSKYGDVENSSFAILPNTKISIKVGKHKSMEV